MAQRFLFIIVFIFAWVNALAQGENETTDVDIQPALLDTNELKPRAGIFAHYGLNIHASDFTNLPGVSNCCPQFTGTTGSGFRIGALGIYPFDYKYFATLRAGWNFFSGQFGSVEPTTVIIDGVSQPGEFEHLLDFEYGELSINPMFGYRARRRLIVEAGLSVGFPIYTDYYQREEVSKPADRGTFIDGGRRRNESSGEMPEAEPVGVALAAGASYEFPLREDRALLIAPEFFYKFHLTPFVKDINWNSHNFYLGASVRYKQPPPPPPPPPPPLPSPWPDMPPPPRAPELYVDIDAVEIDSNSAENLNFSIKIEDFISLNMRPLLNYVFFDSMSARIPDRYILLDSTETAGFGLKQLRSAGALETYYHVLNIIGKRLRNNPETRITLVGTNSNTGGEKGNRDLSRDRAQAIRDYLATTWGIEDNRMRIVARNLPRKYSRTDEPNGRQENRRVEIISHDTDLSEPVITVDTMRVISAKKIRFMPEVDAEAGIRQWSLSVRQGRRELLSRTGNRPPENIEWVINENDKNSPKTAENIEYKLTARDSLGQTASTNLRRLPVEKISIDRKRLERIEDKEFEYYSLILFDYGTSRLDREHRRTVDFVKDRVTDEAEVYIYGYTDRIGEEDVNKRISERRARAVARRLRIPDAKVEGLGETDLLYDNDLPEGRFYCRTVRIIIETPVNDNGD